MRRSFDARFKAWWKQKGEKLLVPVLSAFLCFVFVVVRPWSQLGGQYAFLCYTSLLLFFFPTGRVATQFEITVLSLVGAALGLGWTVGTIAISAYCNRKYGVDSASARAVLGIGLGCLALITGFIRSAVPRLTTATRIGMFYAIFQLTTQQTVVKVHAELFTNQFLVACHAAAFALLFTVVFAGRSSKRDLTTKLTACTELTCRLLSLSLEEMMPGHYTPGTATPGAESSDGTDVEAWPGGFCACGCGRPDASPRAKEQAKLGKQLKASSAELRALQTEVSSEIAITRTDALKLWPVVNALGHMSRNQLLNPHHVPGDRIKSAVNRAHMQTPGPSRPVSRPASFVRSPGQRSLSPSSPFTRRHTRTRSDPWRSQHEPSRDKHDDQALSHRGRQGPASHGIPGPVLQIRLEDLSQGLTTPRGTARKPLSEATDKLKGDICACLQGISCAFTALLKQEAPWDGEGLQKSLRKTKEQLQASHSDFQIYLSVYLMDLPPSHPRSGSSSPRAPYAPGSPSMPHAPGHTHGAHYAHTDRDPYRVALYMTALLDLAKDVTDLVEVVEKLVVSAEDKPKWRFPNVFWFWRPSGTIGAGDRDKDGAAETARRAEDPASDLRDEVTQHDFNGLEFQAQEEYAKKCSGGHWRHEPHKKHRSTRAVYRAWRNIWDRPGTLHARIKLSRFFRSFKQSAHVRLAIKQALGVSLLSIPAFLPPGTPGRYVFYVSRGEWAVISYIFVLETHTGAIFKIGLLRAVGTFIGALAAYICTLIAHGNPYALVALATACSFPISYVILFSPQPALGTVAGITLPPLLFLGYLGRSEGEDPFTIAWYRFVDITIGIGAAVIMGSFLWPSHARVKFFSVMSRTLGSLGEYYLRLTKDNFRQSLVYRDNAVHYAHLESSIRSDIGVARSLVSIQRNEFSLLPRPIRLYSEMIDSCESLLDIFSEIRVLRFSVPRKATVLDVLPIRRELVSAVSATLWACSQAFRSREALPPFLPSPHIPLAELTDAIDHHARQMGRNGLAAVPPSPASTLTPLSPLGPFGGGNGHSGAADGPTRRETSRERTSDPPHRDKLSVLYALAENEALSEACDVIDELVGATRDIFGSQRFLGISAKEQKVLLGRDPDM